MALTTFLFNGVASTAYGVAVEEIERPILPKTRERLLTIPTRHGQWDFGPYFDPVIITFTCWIVEHTRRDLNADTDAIATWLDPRNGAKQLIISDEPDRYWNARYSGELNIKYIASYGSFKIPFICTDPFPHSI